VTRSRFFFLPLLLIFIGHFISPAPCRADQAQTLVVLIDHDPKGFHYRVAGKPVSADLLTALRRSKPDWPTGNTKVILIVHDRSSLSLIDNSRGIIEKAGYEPPRVFYFDDNKRAMVELSFSAAIPFSEKGPS
jgi:hypothetical protein